MPIPLGGSNLGRFFAQALARKRGNPSSPAYWGRKIHDATTLEDQYSFDAERGAYERAKSFDPSAAYGTYMEGARSKAADTLGQQLKQLAGQAVGAGRLDTGFYDMDQGDVVRNVWDDYGRTASAAALQTAGMQQQNNFGLLNYGAEARNRYLDLLHGGYDRATAEKAAKDAKKGGFLGGLGKIVGGVVGSVAGPVGSAFGAKLAGSIFK